MFERARHASLLGDTNGYVSRLRKLVAVYRQAWIRLETMKKLEELKKAALTSQEAAESQADEAADGMRQ
jgi:hypothetical protein